MYATIGWRQLKQVVCSTEVVRLILRVSIIRVSSNGGSTIT